MDVKSVFAEIPLKHRAKLAQSKKPEPLLSEGLLVPYNELHKMPTARLMELQKEGVCYSTKLDIAAVLRGRTKEIAQVNADQARRAVLLERPWAYKTDLKKGELQKPDNRKSLIKAWFVLKNNKKEKGWNMTFYSYDFANEREIFEQYPDHIGSKLATEGTAFLENFHGTEKPLNGYKKLLDMLRKHYDNGVLLHMRMYCNQVQEQQPDGSFLPTMIRSWSHNAQKANSHE